MKSTFRQSYDDAAKAVETSLREFSRNAAHAKNEALAAANSMLKKGQAQVSEFGEWSQENAQGVWEYAKESASGFREYYESDQFEVDLDELARRMNVVDPVFLARGGDRWNRVHRKVAVLVQHSRNAVGLAMAAGAATGGKTGDPQTIAVLTLLFGGAQGAIIAYQCHQVFIARKQGSMVPQRV